MAVVAARTTSASDNFILLAIPLFMLAGSLMSAGGIAQRLFDLARVLVGHLTGGLAQVNVALERHDRRHPGLLRRRCRHRLQGDHPADARRGLPGGPLGGDHRGLRHAVERHPAVHRDADLRVDGEHLGRQALRGRHRAGHPHGPRDVGDGPPRLPQDGIRRAPAAGHVARGLDGASALGARPGHPGHDRRRDPLRLLHRDRGRRVRRARHVRARHAGVPGAARSGTCPASWRRPRWTPASSC